jgi:hypothetical protein
MAGTRWVRMTLKRRHRDGLGCGCSECIGGRVRDESGDALYEQGDDQFCVDPTSRKFGCVSGEFIEAGQALIAFECQLDLPAHPVEIGDDCRGKLVDRERGQKKDEFGGLEGPTVGLATALFGVLDELVLGFARLFLGFAPDHQSQGERFGIGQPFIEADFGLGAGRLHLSQLDEEVEGLALPRQEAQGIPSNAHDEIGTRFDHRPQIVRSGIATIGQDNVAGLKGEPRETLAAVDVGQLQRVDAAAGNVVGDVQPPSRAIGAGLAQRGRIDGAQAVPVQTVIAQLDPFLKPWPRRWRRAIPRPYTAA